MNALDSLEEGGEIRCVGRGVNRSGKVQRFRQKLGGKSIFYRKM